MATLLLCVYIMANGLGLVPELDFGAGAYYYADIPEFDRYTAAAEEAFASGQSPPVPQTAHSEPSAQAAQSLFSAHLPLWVYILLFLGWGYLMWRLWVRLEKRR